VGNLNLKSKIISLITRTGRAPLYFKEFSRLIISGVGFGISWFHKHNAESFSAEK